jgi:ABC-2 type transport system ATP-binding protein
MDIILNNVVKKYGSKTALDGVNLELNEGGVTCLLGPNGAGKTTMLKVLTNLTHPSSGYASIDGIKVHENPQKALMRVGSLVEQPEFYPYLKGREILDFICRIRGIPKNKITEEIERVSSLTGSSGYLDRKAGGYSRGMKQRLGLACSLVSDPEFLILDEPTFGLDPRGMKEMRDVIREFGSRKGKSVLMSTHLVSEARELCDRIIIFNNGNVADDRHYRSDDLLIKVTLETETEIRSEHSGFQIVENFGKTLILRRDSGIRTSDIINALQSEGIAIKFIEPYNDIEAAYMSNVK